MAMASGLPAVAVQAAMCRRETEDGATLDAGARTGLVAGVCNAGTAAPAELAG